MKKILFTFLPLIIFSFGVLTINPAHSETSGVGFIQIKDPYAFATTSAQKNGAIFLQIRNHDPSRNVHLEAVKTKVAERVEIHEMTMDGDTMKMRQVENIVIPAGGEIVTLDPHGLHLMLMELKEPLKEGETFEIFLSYDNSEIQKLEVEVIKPGTKPVSEEDNAEEGTEAEDTSDHDHGQHGEQEHDHDHPHH